MMRAVVAEQFECSQRDWLLVRIPKLPLMSKVRVALLFLGVAHVSCALLLQEWVKCRGYISSWCTSVLTMTNPDSLYLHSSTKLQCCAARVTQNDKPLLYECRCTCIPNKVDSRCMWKINASFEKRMTSQSCELVISWMNRRQNSWWYESICSAFRVHLWGSWFNMLNMLYFTSHATLYRSEVTHCLSWHAFLIPLSLFYSRSPSIQIKEHENHQQSSVYCRSFNKCPTIPAETISIVNLVV